MEKGHRRGFTLVEVMIVMLLFSMLLLIDTLKPEIEVEESRSGRVLVTVRVMDGKKDLYERNGSVQTGDGAGYNPRQSRIRSTDSNSRTVCVSERGMSYDRKRKMGCWAY